MTNNPPAKKWANPNQNKNQKQATQRKKACRWLIICFKYVYSIFHNERNVNLNDKLCFIFQMGKIQKSDKTQWWQGVGKQILSCLLVETKLVQAFAGEFGDTYQNEESGSDAHWMQIPDSAVVGPNLDQSLSSAACQDLTSP